ncbi:MAG: hypothetical protein ACI4YB_02075 [Oscillospiraceae bacterium]
MRNVSPVTREDDVENKGHTHPFDGITDIPAWLTDGGMAVSGADSYTFDDSVDYPLLGLNIFGRSVQNGTPTPNAPIDIVSVGDSGNITITCEDQNGYSLSAEITSALPLCGIPVSEGGNYTDSNGQQWICDTLVYNADSTGKIIKRINKAILNGSSDEVWASTATANGISTGTIDRRFYISMAENLKPIAWSSNDLPCQMILCDLYSVKTNNETYRNVMGVSVDSGSKIIFYDSNYCTLTVNEWKTHLTSNPITIAYQLATPFEIELTATEVDALRTLQTFDRVTNVSNSAGVEMSVKYCTNKVLSECVMPITKGLQKQIDELRAAVLSLGGNV